MSCSSTAKDHTTRQHLWQAPECNSLLFVSDCIRNVRRYPLSINLCTARSEDGHIVGGRVGAFVLATNCQLVDTCFKNTPYLDDLNVKFWLTRCTVIGTNSHRGIVDVLQLSGLCPRLVRRGLGHSALLYCTTLAVLQPGQGSCITLLAVVFHCASLSFRIRRHACYKNLRATDWEGSQIIIFAVFFLSVGFSICTSVSFES